MPLDTNFTNQKFKQVGTRPLRPDGVDKVTGRAKYGADYNAPGQLIALVLRSPHAHARIKKIDTSKAEKLAGVKAIITSADLPDLTAGDRGMRDMLENCMARKKVLYDGHAVAAVAAIDQTTARKALKLIQVDYEILPHVTDVDEALKPSAPVIHNDIFTEGVEPKPTKPSNNNKRASFGHGDIEQGFRDADIIVEHTYKTEQTHQGYIEPHACVANVSPDGQGELWVCTQGHFVYRNQCAALLGMDISKLRVTASEIGGGFGGKTHIWTEPLALALSRKANRPVKLTMSREEVFRCSGPDKLHLHRHENRCEARWHHHRRPWRAPLSRRRLPRHLGRVRRHDGLRLLRSQERQKRKHRGHRQPPEDGRLPCAVGPHGGLRR